jgi:hypothetical protein
MSSNSALLSNSMSPLINSVEVKSNYEGFRYKLLSGVGACSKQRRTVEFQPVFGGSNSINLLKYGLCQKIYLRVPIRDSYTGGTGDQKIILGQGGLINAIDEITLSSHSKILERLDRVAILKYILDKAKSDQDNIFALTGYNSLGEGAIPHTSDYVTYIPLPFSFFGSMDKAKDLLHLQQLTVNISWASQSDAVKMIVSGDARSSGNAWVYQPAQLVINYLELPSAKLNELWNQNYSTNKPTNQLLLTTFKENEKLITVSSTETDFAIDLTTKGCVVKSYIIVRPDLAEHGTAVRSNYQPINKISFRCNGQDFYKAETDEYEFERCIMSDYYNAMSAGKQDRADYHAIYEINHSVVPEVAPHKKYSQAISFKNLSAPQYVLSIDNSTFTKLIVEVIHVQLNLVAFSKQDGSCESILSI